jgi:ribosomal protein L29
MVLVMAAGLKKKDLRGMSEEDLLAKLSELRAEIAKERSHIASGTRPEKPGKIRAARRMAARIITILGERKRKKAA